MSATQAPAWGDSRRLYDSLSRAYDLIADSSEHTIRDRGIRALGLASGQRVLEVGYGTGHGLVALGRVVGLSGHVHGIDISDGMTAVARERVESANLRNVTFTIADARHLCFPAGDFDAAFMSFTLELFQADMAAVLAEMRRVLRVGGRLGVVAMAETGQTNAMIDLYAWAHRRWPHLIDCRPIDVEGVLRSAGFDVATVEASAMWTLPVVAVTAVKPLDGST